MSHKLGGFCFGIYRWWGNTVLISSVPNKLLKILESIADTAIVLLLTHSTLEKRVLGIDFVILLRVTETVNLRSVWMIIFHPVYSEVSNREAKLKLILFEL
jgi:hypothetical protein